MVSCPGCSEKMVYYQKDNVPSLYCPWCGFKVTLEQTGGPVKTKEQFIRKAIGWIEKKKKAGEPFCY